MYSQKKEKLKSISLKFNIIYGLRRCDSCPSNGYSLQAGITPMVAWDIIGTSETVDCLDVLHPEWVASLFLYLFPGLQVLMENSFPSPWPSARTAAVTAGVMSCRWRLKACRCWTHPGAPGTLFLRETCSCAPSWSYPWFFLLAEVVSAEYLKCKFPAPPVVNKANSIPVRISTPRC